MNQQDRALVVGSALASILLSAIALLAVTLIWLTPVTSVAHKSDLNDAGSKQALIDQAKAYVEQGGVSQGLKIIQQTVVSYTQPDPNTTLIKIRVISDKLQPVVLDVELHRGLWSVESVVQSS